MTTGPAYEHYWDGISELKQKVFHSMAKTYSKLEQGRISASLFHLRPEIPVPDHELTIRDIYFHQRWAERDQNHLELLVPALRQTGAGLALLDSSSVKVLCGFHLGSYRLIVPYTLSRGMKVSMLIDKRVAEKQASDFYRLVGEFCTALHIPQASFRIRDTSSRTYC